MTVGKAKSVDPEGAGDDFRFTVPCFTGIDEAAIRDHLLGDKFEKLGLRDPGPEERTKLREIFGFHPLALEDIEHFGQRPKLDDYDDHVFLVFCGAWRHGSGDTDPLRRLLRSELRLSGQPRHRSRVDLLGARARDHGGDLRGAAPLLPAQRVGLTAPRRSR